ncbi:carbohydrate kinase family protein [Thermasporomyces composti]|jgi:fructokinase|uniref:Fructokinase n=1 Tax=Thermasporomyces composti TaxID=696763 RepID=A0A3D9VCD5_THECX|nr:carbohydrate kinase [Thermasporomyces composti]REF35834.1 fructokinase [Thermasporomyces composti]
MITVIGEALIDLVGDGTVYRATPGGSPLNVAVGLARLGVPCALLARLSSDTFGSQLRDHLRRNGVSLRHAVSAAEPTTLAFAFLDAEGSARYEFYVEGTADWQWTQDELPSPLPAEVTAVHAGSLAVALPPGAPVLEEFLRRERTRGAVTLSYDPNIRPHLCPDKEATRARVERQVRLAHVVKASAEDVAWLYPDTPLDEVLRRWTTLGPQLVVLTLGADGAVARQPDGPEVRVDAPTVRVVDTVGAGDAFTSALLAGLARRDLLAVLRDERAERLRHDLLAELLAASCRVAAFTCTRPGADPPTRDEVDLDALA